MKIIDKTPLVPESGKLGLMDQVKATLQYGPNWYAEVQAQQQILPLFSQTLDRNYTLVRNLMPPGLGAMIPFILIGPPGVFVMYVTHLRGVYRAKGNEWGTISGNTFKAATPNLLNVTARLARAVQVYLKRRGYEQETIEAALLCADPGMYVDSQRPIVRVVMRDALERFIISLSQGRVVLTPERVSQLTDYLLNPRPAQEAEAPAQADQPAQADPYVPAFALPESEAAPQTPPATTADWLRQLADAEAPQSAPPVSSLLETAPTPPRPSPAPAGQPRPARRPVPPRKRGLTPIQWAFLAAIGLIEICALIGFAYLILSNSR